MTVAIMILRVVHFSLAADLNGLLVELMHVKEKREIIVRINVLLVNLYTFPEVINC